MRAGRAAAARPCPRPSRPPAPAPAPTPVPTPALVPVPARPSAETALQLGGAPRSGLVRARIRRLRRGPIERSGSPARRSSRREDASGLTRRRGLASGLRPLPPDAAPSALIDFFADPVRAGPGRRRRGLRDRLLRARDPGLPDAPAGLRGAGLPQAARPARRQSSAPAPAGEAGSTRTAVTSSITSAARSRTARWPGAGWSSPGRPIRSTSSSSRSRARGGCGCPTAA